MATKLFLRNTAANAISNFYDMVVAAGASAGTGVVNTAAGGTQIQWTRTAGGTVLEWISGRVPSGGFTLAGTISFSIWAKESNMLANIGARARVFKRTAAGSESEVGGGPYNDGVEFGTGDAEMTWTGTPTSTAFSENDRIIVRYYITNVGTMATGYTGTITYNAADAATGDSFFQINENVTFKSEPVTHATTGTLTGPGSTVVGSASNFTSHATSGVLTGPGSTVDGSAARAGATVTHATTGVLTGQGSTVVGSASSATTRASSGVLIGPGSTIVGSAARTRAHPSTGVLVGAGSTVVGSASSATTRPSSGVLVGPGSVIVGSASRTGSTVTHDTSGTLVGPGSTVVGSASSATVRTSSGVLVGQGSAVVGTAAHVAKHSTSGVLTGQGSTVTGSATRFRTHDTSGVLTGADAIIVGAASISTGPVAHATSGSLVGAGAVIVGSAGRTPLYPNESDVRLGVVYGPGGIYTGAMTGGGSMIMMRRR